MASTSQQARSKVRRTRVKTGCATCRKRRIKCDEARPACGRCVLSGWECDGYGAAAQTQPSTVLAQRQRSSIISYSIPFCMPGSRKDRQFLHYYCSQGAAEISGFLSTKFWSETVLRQSHHEPAIRQVLVALSSLHLQYTTSDAPTSTLAPKDTLAQYGKGLQMLRKRLGQPSSEGVRIALISSIMLYCFETALGDSNAAILHLDKGLMLLRSVKDITNEEDGEAIFDLLARLDIQATLFNDSRVPILTLTTPDERKNGFIDSPELPFTSIHEAQKNLGKLQNWFFRFLSDNFRSQPVRLVKIPPGLLGERNLLDWHFTAWLQKSQYPIPTTTPDEKAETECGMNILSTQHGPYHMLLKSYFLEERSLSKSVFEMSPNPEAREIVRRAESVIRYLEQKGARVGAKTPWAQRRTFSSETGVIVVLFFLIFKCADEYVVEKATELLSQTQRQEGLVEAASMMAILNHLNAVRQAKASASVGRTEGFRTLEDWTEHDIISEEGVGMNREGKLLLPPTIIRH
uniref:Zn(2)-C6 fungal-type domain-containing protein n=2 Tax=Bionectria ochroleuca TaxID=29856 RepID=A0A0B7K467_BIOOC